ncbi:hypothetical protein BSKO_13829 [Bryopsis sp. KO-2023]|nr:hypothetical protein BSKO_13829 [Bryopsis sp. KO-2023]
MVSTVVAQTVTPFKASKAVSGTRVVSLSRRRTVRPAKAVQAKLDEKKLTAAAVVATTMLANPLVAQATERTTSVNALLGSVVNGGIVALFILGAVTIVAGFDPVNR